MISMFKARKEKEKKIGTKKVLSNNYFLLRIIVKAAPVYTIALLIESIRHPGMVFFEHTFGINFILESVEFGRTFPEVLRFLIMLTGLIALSGIYSNLFYHYIEVKYLPKLQQELKLKLYEKARQLDLACYDNPDYYNEFVLAVSEAERSIDRMLQLIRMLFSGLTLLLCYGIFFLSKDFISLLFVLASFVLRFFFKGLSNKLRYRVRLQENPLERKRSYINRVFYLNEYAKELRLNKEASDLLYQQFEETNKELYDLNKKVARKRFVLDLLAHYICTHFVLDVLYISYLVYQAAVRRLISYSNVVVLYNSAGDLRRGFATMADLLPQATELSLYIEKIRSFLSYETRIVSRKKLPVPVKPEEYELKEVSFAYNEQGNNIIDHLNMTIKPYEKIALVGYNGAGKTTLTKLLMRLYDTKEGSISLRGTDIRDYDVDDYRGSIGAVFQDYRLYAATVRENVVMDITSSADTDMVLASLHQSGFSERLSSLKEGINTPLTTEFEENGVELSGGESQKLAVARGFYKDTSLIILDEPSSALDPIAEYNLNKFMFEAAKDKTVIFISHRLSTTRKADRIFMLEHGRIIEEGTHEDLLKQNGKYAGMWIAQAGKYAD